MAGHAGEGGFFDSVFEFLGGALGGAIGGPLGAAVGSRLGGAVIGSGAVSTAPISAQTAGLVLGGVVPGPVDGTLGFGQGFSPQIGEIARTVGPFALPVAREIATRFLERGPMPNGAGSLVTIPGPGGQVVCKPVSRREIILLTAKAHAPGATARKIVKAAKDCGFEIAAAMFGIPILDVCWLAVNVPRRRGRGISSRDLRNCNRVLRSMHRNRTVAKKALGGK